MKFLIAGFGSIGRRHFRNLLALGESDILFFRSHHSTLPEDELEGFRVETDLDSALGQRPEAVIISNPTSLHLDVAIPAARAGCHLLLEKPVSHSVERLDELREAVQHSGAQVLIGFQFRFHPGLQQVARLLAQGAVGRPLAVRAHWGEYLPDWHPWEDYQQGYSARPDLGGGVVLTLSHPFDYLRWLLGEIQALWAFTTQTSELNLAVEDGAEIGMQFVSGVLGSVHLNYVQRPTAHWLEIVGTQGTLRWDSADGAAWHYAAGQGVWQEHPAPPGFERNDLFLAELRHFLAVARGETSPACTLEDGERALQLALAAHHSARRETVVHFSGAERSDLR